MVALAAVLLWQRRPRDIALTALVLAVLWGGLVLTFSQSSFAALLVGLIVIACVRWRPWPILAGVGAVGLVALVVVVAAPGAVGIDTGSKNPLDKATSGRFELLARRARHVRRPARLRGTGRARSPSASASARTRARAGRRRRRTRSP